MTDLSQAISNLIAHARGSLATSYCLSLDQAWSPSPLTWLQAQSDFPKLYWQSRDNALEVYALGAAKTFSGAEQAEHFLQQYSCNQAGDPQIWGGVAFDRLTLEQHENAQAMFFLPRLEISRCNSGWQIRLNCVAEDTPEQVADWLAALICQQDDKNAFEAAPSKVLKVKHQPEQARWCALVNQSLTAIAQTALQKVVLARKTELQLSAPLEVAGFIQRSLTLNTGCFHFMLSLTPDESFIGASPERLFVREGDQLATEALAGTTGRSADAQQDAALATWLLNDSKNNYENQLVVEDIQTRLSPLSEPIDIEPTAHLLKLRNVQHLKRNIQAMLKQNILNHHLLSALQPTAAIAGLPRELAVNFINQYEPITRGWYSGALGYIGRAKSEFCVAIRSAMVKKDTLELYAGAGIVPGSDPIKEWGELDKKTAALLSLLTPPAAD